MLSRGGNNRKNNGLLKSSSSGIRMGTAILLGAMVSVGIFLLQVLKENDKEHNYETLMTTLAAAATTSTRTLDDTTPPVTTPTVMGRKRKLTPATCRSVGSGHEILLESLIGILFQDDGIMPAGSVLDVGAQFGEQACHYAVLAPDRIVHALDPSPKNIAAIKESKWFLLLPNLRVMEAGVGREVGTLKARDASFRMPVGQEFRIETLDSLFYDKGETLGFAHIDVEGLELDVLHGAKKTLDRDKPIFTVEVRVHQNPTYTAALIDYIHELGYDPYVVDEVCGYPHMDYRNLLAVPRELAKTLISSHAFNTLVASETIKGPVTSQTIFQNVYPCCALGAECCPSGNADDHQCCGEDVVLEWLEKNGIRHMIPKVKLGFKHSRQDTMRVWYRLGRRNKLSAEETKRGDTR